MGKRIKFYRPQIFLKVYVFNACFPKQQYSELEPLGDDWIMRILTSLISQPIGILSLSALWEVTEILEEPG